MLTSIDDLRETEIEIDYDTFLKGVDKSMCDVLSSSIYWSDNEPLRYILDSSGKKIRSLICLVSYLTYASSPKVDLAAITRMASGIELLHLASLVHDDIMDKADLRRGKKTVHTIWGNDIAILTGDILLLKGVETVFDSISSDTARVPRMLPYLKRMTTEVTEGQRKDISVGQVDVISYEHYIEMVALKTGSLLSFCLTMGGLLNDCGEEEPGKLDRLGRSLGIGYQLQDDSLDVFACEKTTGKSTGVDILSGKLSFFVNELLLRASAEDCQFINELRGNTAVPTGAKVEVFKKLYDKYSLQQKAHSEWCGYYDEAVMAIDSLNGRTQFKNILTSIVGSVRGRMY